MVHHSRSRNWAALVEVIPPHIIWCVVCALAAWSAIASDGRIWVVLVLAALVALPVFFGSSSSSSAHVPSVSMDGILWILATGIMILLTGGSSSPMTILFILPILSCLERRNPLAAIVAGLLSILCYIVVAAAGNAGFGTAVREAEFLAMPLSLGALVLICFYVVRIVDTMSAALHAKETVLSSRMFSSQAGGAMWAYDDTQGWNERDEALTRAANAERKNRAAEKALSAHASNLAARMGFIADLGNEMRTSLHSVIGFAEEVKKSLASSGQNAECVEYAGYIYQTGRDLQIVVDDLEDLARISAGTYRLSPAHSVDVDEILVWAKHTLSGRAGELGSVEISKTGIFVEADPRAIRQIALNLLAYILEAGPRDGQTGLWALTSPEGDVRLGVQTASSRLSEEQETIMRKSLPLRTPDSDAPSLYLATARAFAELHGGSIRATTRPDGGFYIWVHLPRIADVDPAKAGSLRKKRHKDPVMIPD